jgi:hypothetical protein
MSSFIPDNYLATSVLSVRNVAAEEKARKLFSGNAVFCDRKRGRDESPVFYARSNLHDRKPAADATCHGGKGTSRLAQMSRGFFGVNKTR